MKGALSFCGGTKKRSWRDGVSAPNASTATPSLQLTLGAEASSAS